MKNTILAVCAHDEIRSVLLRLLSKRENTIALVAADGAEMRALLEAHPVEVLLMGSGFSETEEAAMKQFVAQHHPKVSWMAHYRGGSGLLESEIRTALAQRGSEG
ncbi:MAG: hypothetical protein ACFB10_01880 [Salibacteraceae bacterium]